MAPHRAPCGGRGGMVDVGTTGEEVGAEGVGFGIAEDGFGAAGEEIGSCDGGTGGGAGE